MNRKIIIIICVVSLFFLNGCASIMYRTNQDDDPVQPGIYPAVRSDTETLDALRTKDYDPLLTGAEPIIFTLALIDIPLAFVLDTILLPYDILHGGSNMKRAKALVNKYLPDYKIAKNTNPNKDAKGAYFYLISPAGERIDIHRDWSYGNNGRSFEYPTLNSLLEQENILISKKDEAAEMVILVDMLMFGRFFGSQWKYQVNRIENFWSVVIVGEKGGTRGHVWKLEVDNKDILQNISTKF